MNRLFVDFCAGDAAARAFYSSMPADFDGHSRPPLPAHWQELVRLLAAQNALPSAAPPLAALEASELLVMSNLAPGTEVIAKTAGRDAAAIVVSMPHGNGRLESTVFGQVWARAT